MSAPIKTCPCGLAYDAAAWAELPLNGHQKLDPPDEPDSGERIELRTCPCNSTLAVLVHVQPASRKEG